MTKTPLRGRPDVLKKKTRNRAAQEATLINLRALKKEVAGMKRGALRLSIRQDAFYLWLAKIDQRLRKVEKLSHGHGHESED